MSDERPPMFSKTMSLRWGEMDAMRHLNNVSYFRYMEEARIAWFWSLGFDYERDGEGSVLGSVSLRFVRPAVYPAKVAVELRAGRIGNASFTLEHSMRDAEAPGVVYAQGEAVLVWIDLASGKPKPVPAAIRAVLQA